MNRSCKSEGKEAPHRAKAVGRQAVAAMDLVVRLDEIQNNNNKKNNNKQKQEERNERKSEEKKDGSTSNKRQKLKKT